MKWQIVCKSKRAAVFFSALPVQKAPPELLAGLVLLLALGGGMQFFITPAWGLLITAVLLAGYLLALPLVIIGPRPALLLPALLMVSVAAAGVLLSPTEPARARLLLLGGGLAFLQVGRAYPFTRSGLLLAGWLWPVIWLLATLITPWYDNPNISAAFTVVLTLVLLSSRRRAAWLAVVANVALLFFLGSRGAILGLTAGLMVYLWPFVRPRRLWLLVLPVFPLLVAIRPLTAAYRLHYWYSALITTSLLGVGQAGLWTTHAITEPGGGYQIHAHNTLVTWLAESGWLGLLAIIPLLFYAKNLIPRLQRWQLAALAALLAHGMVDDPLWWPGPLLLAAIIASQK